MFIEWLYCHLKMYNKVNIIDTTFYKFEWQGKEITQQEAIDLLIKACRKYLKDVDEDHPEYFKDVMNQISEGKDKITASKYNGTID